MREEVKESLLTLMAIEVELHGLKPKPHSSGSSPPGSDHPTHTARISQLGMFISGLFGNPVVFDRHVLRAVDAKKSRGHVVLAKAWENSPVSNELRQTILLWHVSHYDRI